MYMLLQKIMNNFISVFQFFSFPCIITYTFVYIVSFWFSLALFLFFLQETQEKYNVLFINDIKIY